MAETVPDVHPESPIIRQKLQGILDNFPHNDGVIRDGEYCRSSNFLMELGDEEIQKLLLIYAENGQHIIPMLLAQLSESYLLLYFKTKSLSDLKIGVAIGSLVAYHTSLAQENTDRGALLSVFGRSLLLQSQEFPSDTLILNESIEYCRKAVILGDPNGWNRSLHLNDLGQQLTTRYNQTHNEDDYVEAENAFQEAITLKPAGKPVFLLRWAKLVRARDEFESCDKAEMLRKYITKLSEAVRSERKEFKNAEYRVSISRIWWNVGCAIWERYELAKNPEDLQKASEIFGIARTAPQHDSMDRFYSCRDLGRVNALQFKNGGSSEKAESAVKMLKEALEVMPDSLLVMESLANHLLNFANHTDSDEMIAESVEILEQAISTNENPANSVFDAYALTLMSRFRRKGKSEDIEMAIQKYRSLADRSQDSESDHAQYLLKLAQCLLLRFESLEQVEDLENSQAEAERAASFEDVPRSLKGDCLHLQGLISNARYKWSNKPESLDQAIGKFQESLHQHVANGSSKGYLVQNDLANAYFLKFKRTLLLEDLSESINEYDSALRDMNISVLDTSQKDSLMITHGLAIALTAQFEITQQQQDIDRAIICYEKCYQGATRRTLHGVIRANNLALAYQERFKLTSKMTDVQKSQAVLIEVLAWNLDLQASQKSNLYNNLGRAFLLSYIQCKEPSYLNYAADNFRKAIATGCTLPAFQLAASVNLSRVLLYKAKHTKQHLDQVAVLQQFLQTLGIIKSSQNDADQAHMDGLVYNLLEYTLDTWEESSFSTTSTYGQLYLATCQMLLPRLKTIQSSTIARFYIYASIAQHTIMKQPKGALDMIRIAAEILPKSMLFSFDRKDILNNLGNFVALPSFTISCSLEAKYSPQQALELFDKVRSVMWNSVLSSKLSLRENENEDLADLLTKQEHIVNLMATNKTPKKNQFMSSEELGGMLVQQHEVYRQGVEYKQIAEQLESNPEYERLMHLPENTNSLVEYAKEGPIIIVNYGLFRSDAVLVTTEGVVSLPLPSLTGEALNENDNMYQEALKLMSTDLVSATQKLNQVLQWLWDSIAEPILEQLGFDGALTDSADLPRTWWISTGRIGTFPLHAAGNPRKGPTCTVLDRTIPSYINGLRALKFVRSRRFSKEESSPLTEKRALLISMESTPQMGDEGDLPNALEEVTNAQEIFKQNGGKAKLLQSPNRTEVLRHLLRADYAHFACHGFSDGDDPAKSALRLMDWQTRPLDIECLLQQSQKDMKIQLVYLSACESASNKSKFRDEGLHLAGGFQMAGVPHVIASLWRASDEFSLRVAMRFYQILGALGSNFDSTQSAKALRRVIVEMRDSGESPLLWATYIHLGP
ncbi:hypothetical protein PENSTE_c005G05551 [Penicillium steckii]|uniref:CHAT domain-containing protein n=1 Tax=Penicillium steckii TaxID=303698 RepID=A0A1V6TJH7_9EURO|nr:hypothetical protein PENSTE_c005G05551 [Penicillium steckii]